MMGTPSRHGRRTLLPLILTLTALLATTPRAWSQDAPPTGPADTEAPATNTAPKPDPTPSEPSTETPTDKKPTEPAAAPEAPAEKAPTVSERIDGVFGKIVGVIAPVLFYDATQGVFDPSLETVNADLAKAEADLAAAKAADEPLHEQKRIERRIKKLNGWKATLEAKASAPERLKQAQMLLDDYRNQPAEQQNEKKLAELEADVATIEKEADATIHSVPLIILFLLGGGIFFTFRYGFINVRLFTHSIAVIRGKYDNPDDHGEISHFQALTSALSATVGLGNIAGVAIAISMGGAGAVFWMWVVAFFGMSSKFSSCTLAQVYRRISGEAKDHGAADEMHPPEGKSQHVLGGPMVYLTEGMKEVFGKAIGTPVGRALAILFAFFAICGSLGGGNMFQGNQTFALFGDIVFQQTIDGHDELVERVEAGDAAAAKELREKRIAALETQAERKQKYAWVGGLVLTILVGIVIVGGIKRIGEVTSKLVPAMCVFYVGVCAIIVFANAGEIPDMIMDIFAGAFSEEALAWGGIMGVLVIGVQRGAFSNEAGLGSAAIAHSAAKTKEPVREGVVAMIGPFIDTIIVCTMTALAILITKAHTVEVSEGFTNAGVGITAAAFSQLAPELSYMLAIAVAIFAYSTMISWSYYGERASEYLFGHAGIWPFRVVFLAFVFMGPMLSLGNVIDFTDLLILSMAYPNILGMIFLSKKVAGLARDYVRRLRSGEMQPVR